MSDTDRSDTDRLLADISEHGLAYVIGLLIDQYPDPLSVFGDTSTDADNPMMVPDPITVTRTLATLDGSHTSAVSPLTGFSADEIADLGGVDEGVPDA